MSDIITDDMGFDCSGLFDSHAHYFDKRFSVETDGADSILSDCVFGRGIVGVINIGTNNRNSRVCIEQASKYEKMYATVGIHPEDVAYCEKDVSEELDELYSLVRTSEDIDKNKIVAIGEIGFDYHYDGFDKKLQREYFEAQLDIAEKCGLPVVIHDREAHGDCFETVLHHPNVRGVFHSYSGSAEMANELVKRGWYISFSGVLSFKNARKTVEVAEAISMDRILLETDCPYLAPHPYRGRINHSGLMYLTASRLAEIKGLSLDEVARITTENVEKLFSCK